MSVEIAKMLSNALTQYIDNSADMEPAEQPADLALAQRLLDAADVVLALEESK